MNALSEPMHTFGCAFKQRGGECDCDALDPERVAMWRLQAAKSNPFDTEVGRAMSRGFDYTALAGGFDEGIHDDEEGE